MFLREIPGKSNIEEQMDNAQMEDPDPWCLDMVMEDDPNHALRLVQIQFKQHSVPLEIY